MGEGSDAIAADLERKRNALRARSERLERRVRDDIDQAGEEAKAQAQHVVDRARGVTGRDSVLGRHPVATVAGAAATGVALGVATSSHGDDDGRYRLPPHEKHDFQVQEERAEQERRDARRSRNGNVAKKGASAISGVLGAELGRVISDFAGGIIRGRDGREHNIENQEGTVRRADFEPGASSNGRGRMGAEVAPKDHTVDELAAAGSRSERPVEWQGHTYTPGSDDTKPGNRESDARPATPTATRIPERRMGAETAAKDHTVDDLAASGSRTERPVEWQGHTYTPGSDETKPGARE